MKVLAALRGLRVIGHWLAEHHLRSAAYDGRTTTSFHTPVG